MLDFESQLFRIITRGPQADEHQQVVQVLGRIGQMLHNVGQFLAVEGIVILYLLITAIPLILLGALIWWFTRGRRQRDERRLLASPSA